MNLTCGSSLSRRAAPAFLARDGPIGLEASNSTIVTPRLWAIAVLPSVEPESTYTMVRPARTAAVRQPLRRLPSFRPIATIPTSPTVAPRSHDWRAQPTSVRRLGARTWDEVDPKPA